ncbi:hypothetical protein [Klebsiella quasipneumoniae]|uniref:hypothetical protein n=2 Tax=Klebsiella/Raoultella group TaxID=2890311 RepID=UPI001D110458|nr:hypothetical protein [Klebsiella quasipneumoniae]
MKICACHFHPKGFFLTCDHQADFWVLLSPLVGWGRFSMIRPDEEFTKSGGIFQLTELRPADAEPPESVIEASNVLWRLPEAHEVLKSVPSAALQECLQRGLCLPGQ